MKSIFIAAIAVFMSACTVVGPGERGFSISLGKVGSEVREPGAYLWIPFFHGSKTLNIQTQRSDVETSAASKDMQEIKTEVALNWSITPDQVMNVFKNTGDEDSVLRKVISPAVSESLKAATANMTAEEILTKRTELKTQIDTLLRTRLANYGVTLQDVSIVNLTFSKEFTDAIERKQIAEQEAKQAEYVAQKATQQANADVERAKGQAESQRLMKSTITPEVLQMKALERWSGVLPTVMGTNALPFLNLNFDEKNKTSK